MSSIVHPTPPNPKEDQQMQMQEEEEEEYVLLDFGGAFSQDNFAPNTPYTLSGLDSLNPILIIGDGMKLVGEYQETMGKCLVFSESAEEFSLAHEETGPSEANLFAGKCIVDPNQVPCKQIKNVCQLHKVLKFKIVPNETADTKNNNVNLLWTINEVNFSLKY